MVITKSIHPISLILENFQDNDKDIPVILTSSQMLITGVDARNVRNIILVRSIGSIVEFKQIVGRGTRLFDGIEELKRDNLGNLIKLNNLGTVKDASQIFGSPQNLNQAYYGVQRELYAQ